MRRLAGGWYLCPVPSIGLSLPRFKPHLFLRFLHQVKVSLAPVGTIKKDLDENQLQEVVTEIVTAALRGTSVHLNLFQYPNCPRLWREPVTPRSGFSMPVHYDSMVSRCIL